MDRRDPYPRDLDEAKQLWQQRLRYEYLQERLGKAHAKKTAAATAKKESSPPADDSAQRGGKLAPAISPGKTWAGAGGAVAAGLVAALLFARLAPEVPALSTLLQQRLPVTAALGVLAALVALSIVGDLFESLLKRQAGAKDSGRLLPGHGASARPHRCAGRGAAGGRAARPVAAPMRSITLLGATGSIGASTLDVIARHPDRFSLFAVAAWRSDEALVRLFARFRPRYAVIADMARLPSLRDALRISGLITVSGRKSS